jgi:DnaJ family protein C protein 19
MESIHEFYRDPHNRELYSKHPQYKHMFDKYDADWGKSSRKPMTYSSIILIGGISIAAGALGLKYAIRALKQLKPGQGTPITDVNEAVERMRGTFYEGGFEKDMSKREAALILGCRETATRERIMDRYRLLMKLNHPDLGGSPHLSTKVNEAKELLSRTARSQEEFKT